MKKLSQDERISILEGRVAALTVIVDQFNRRIEALEKPRALTAAIGDGVVVPREPTEMMVNEFIRVAGEGRYKSGEGFKPSYHVMIAAAPQPGGDKP